MSAETEKKIGVITLWGLRAAVMLLCSLGIAYFTEIRGDIKKSMENIRSDFNETRQDVKDMTRLVDKHEAKIEQLDKDIDRLDRQKQDKR